MFFFFFQAEDGIRDKLVTGVQTCALPISPIVRLPQVCTNCGIPNDRSEGPARGIVEMGEHASWITQFVNHYLGSAALALLSALHIRPNNPELPIPEHVVMGLLVLAVGTIFALWVRFRLSVERPGASQQVAELLLTNPLGFGITDVLEENAG